MANPITTDDVWGVFTLLENATTLEDLGIQGLRWWKIAATCSSHGRLIRYEETAGDPPRYTGMSCLACQREGVSRICPVEDLDVIVGRKTPGL